MRKATHREMQKQKAMLKQMANEPKNISVKQHKRVARKLREEQD